MLRDGCETRDGSAIRPYHVCRVADDETRGMAVDGEVIPDYHLSVRRNVRAERPRQCTPVHQSAMAASIRSTPTVAYNPPPWM